MVCLHALLDKRLDKEPNKAMKMCTVASHGVDRGASRQQQHNEGGQLITTASATSKDLNIRRCTVLQNAIWPTCVKEKGEKEKTFVDELQQSAGPVIIRMGFAALVLKTRPQCSLRVRAAEDGDRAVERAQFKLSSKDSSRRP